MDYNEGDFVSISNIDYIVINRGRAKDMTKSKSGDYDKEFFIEYCRERFKVEWYICNYDNRYMKLKVVDSKKMNEIILNNIPNDLDIIKYKILEKGGDVHNERTRG